MTLAGHSWKWFGEGVGSENVESQKQFFLKNLGWKEADCAEAEVGWYVDG